MLSHYDYLIKLILVGDSGAGKTALLSSFTGVKAETCFQTTGFEYTITRMPLPFLEEKNINLELYDTKNGSGRPVGQKDYGLVHGVMLLVNLSLSDKEISTAIRNYRNDFCAKSIPYDLVDRVLVVGTQSDKVPPHENAEIKLARCIQKANPDTKRILPFMVTSATERINVEEAFIRLTQQVKTNLEAEERAKLTDKAIVAFQPHLRDALCEQLEQVVFSLSKEPSGFFRFFSTNQNRLERKTLIEELGKLIGRLKGHYYFTIEYSNRCERWLDFQCVNAHPKTRDVMDRLIKHCHREEENIRALIMATPVFPSSITISPPSHPAISSLIHPLVEAGRARLNKKIEKLPPRSVPDSARSYFAFSVEQMADVAKGLWGLPVSVPAIEEDSKWLEMDN